MSIRDWPAAERPREKLLELFLRTGVSGKSAVDLARHLLSRFGSLRNLLESDQQAFGRQLGLGPAKFAQLQAVLEMARRHLAERLRRDSVLESPRAVRDYLKAMLRHEPHEVFACLFLDSKHRVLAFEPLFHGSIDNTSVYPRQVVKRALAHNAAALILCHNHPSGVAEPSQADHVLTKRLKTALEYVDVRVLDHFIVGEGEPLSMMERGWM
jgi:DNA repair protein RadC